MEKIKVEPEFAINEENGRRYELKPNKYKQYPHLAELKKECETVPFGSSKYWKLRCNYLEKTIDETYSTFERDNCREFYKILAYRQ
jgi:hypothetical protein